MNNIKILDLGCGEGNKTIELQKKGQVTGVDISKKAIEKCRQLFPKSKFFVMNAQKLKFSPDSFDEIYCFDVLEHVNNLDKTIENISKVAKINSKIFIDIPHYNSEKFLTILNSKYKNQVGHKRTINIKNLTKILNEFSIEIKYISSVKSLDNLYLAYFFLNKKNIKNQQGQFNINTNTEKAINYLFQYIYTEKNGTKLQTLPSYKYIDKESQKKIGLKGKDLFAILKLINIIGDRIFPKTIRIECRKINSTPKNNLTEKLYTYKKVKNIINKNGIFIQNTNKLVSSLKIKNNVLNKKLVKIRKINKQDKQIIKEIYDSKFWKIYTFIKKIKND